MKKLLSWFFCFLVLLISFLVTIDTLAKPTNNHFNVTNSSTINDLPFFDNSDITLANDLAGNLPPNTQIGCPTISLSPTVLVAGKVGAAYSQTITSTGGTAPITYSLFLGVLPPGLTLSSAGTISGTPTLLGAFAFTLRATDSQGCSGINAYVLTITPACPTITLSPTILIDARVGQSYNQQINAIGAVGTTTFSLTGGNLPPGLNLSSSGLISGTPTLLGTYVFTIRVTDSNGCTGVLVYTLVVLNIQCPTITISPTVLVSGKVGLAYNQNLLSTGGIGLVTFSVVAGTLPSGLILSANGNISGTPTLAGNFSFSVQVVDINGCSASIGISIIINPADIPITLSPSTLPNAIVGTAYSQTITASGGQGPYTFSVTSGSLPPGLTLSSTGTISGTPTSAGNFSFTVTATGSNGSGTGSLSYSLTVASSSTPLTLSPSTLPSATVGTAYSQTITASGGQSPYTFSVTSGSLPPGLTLSSTGTISGTPTSAGNFSFTVTATGSNGSGTGSLSYSLTVASSSTPLTLSPSTLPSATVGTAYSQTISASGGQSPYTFSVSFGSLLPGLTLSSTGTISGTPTTAGNFSFTITASGSNGSGMGSITYNVMVSTSGGGSTTLTLSPSTLPNAIVGTSYNQTVTATGGQSPYSFVLTSGVLPVGLSLSTAGQISGIPTTVGNFTFTITATSSNNLTGSITYTVSVANDGSGGPGSAIALAPATLPNGIVGFTYNQTITATGDTPPYTFSITSGTLPPGLTLFANGSLSGIPVVAGNFTFTVTALSATSRTGSRTYTVSIADNSQSSIVLMPATLPNTVVNAAYDQTITAIGGQVPYTFSVTGGTLPTGLTFLSSGKLGGISTTTGNFTFTLTARDTAGRTGSASYTIRVTDQVAPSITLMPATLPNGIIGSAYNQTISAIGGQVPYTFVIGSGTLPMGLSLSPDGLLSGTPTKVGASTFTVSAIDIANLIGSQTYTIVITSGTISLQPETLPSGTLGVNYNQTITATGGQAPYVFSIAAGSLPPGLTFLASGQLSGVPVTSGNFGFTVIAVDNIGSVGARSYTISTGMILVSPSSLPNGQVNTAYAATITATGGQAPYNFAIAAGNLPVGLTLTSSGQLSGIPTMAGTSSFAIVATDINGFTGSNFYVVNIDDVLSIELSTLYVADTKNNRVQKSLDGINWTEIGRGFGRGPGQFRKPEAVTASADGQTIYVADKGNSRIQKSTNGGATWVNLADSSVVKKPQGVALAPNGDVYVSDGNSRILRFEKGDSSRMTVIATMGNGTGQVFQPHGLAVDLNNNLYVADKGNNRILKVSNPTSSPSFAIVASVGQALAPLGQVRAPQGVGVDNQGNLYVADTKNRRILMFTRGLSGEAILVTTTMAGLNPNQVRAVEGVTISRLLTGPLSGAGVIIFSDRTNNRIIGKIGDTYILVGNEGSDIGRFAKPSKIR